MSMPEIEGVDTSRAADAIADIDCVRFSVLFEVRGLQVFEISAEVLRRLYGASGRGADALLRAYSQHEGEIIRVARKMQGRGQGPVVQLGLDDFSSPGVQ